MRFSRITVMSGIGAAAVIAGGSIAIPGMANAASTRAASAPTASQAYSKANQALNWTNQLNTDIYAKPGSKGFPNGGASYRASTALSTANQAEKDAKAAQATANTGIGDVIHWSTSTSVAAGSYGQVTASCADATGLPAGTNTKDLVAMGGGYELDNGSGDAPGADKFAVTLDRNTPGPNQNDGWIVGGTNNDTSAHTLYAWVTCINAPNDNSGS